MQKKGSVACPARHRTRNPRHLFDPGVMGREGLPIGRMVVLAFLIAAQATANNELPELRVFNNNGGWSWFNSEGAIVHGNRLIVSSVAGDRGAEGNFRGGNMEVTVHDPATGESAVAAVYRFPRGEDDDHNRAGLLALPDDRILAVYSRHSNDRFMRYSHSDPDDLMRWTRPRTADVGSRRATYANVFLLADGNEGSGRVYSFHRGRNRDPNFMYSDNLGKTWQYGGRLIQTRLGRTRPYVRYASNHRNRIHFINTEGHPRSVDNSVYHGYLENGKLYKSSGKLIDANLYNEDGIPPDGGTRVFQGAPDRVAWVSDIHLTYRGHPYIAFSVQIGSAGLPRGRGGDDHRYYYGRWDGEKWFVDEIAYAGTRLYPGEDDYTGNVALNPDNPDEMYISTNVDPQDGTPLISSADGQQHYEIFKGMTSDGGISWKWMPLTRNSGMDNIRPIVPAWNERRTAVIWMRGTYTSYKDYDTRVVGMIFSGDSVPGALSPE